MDRLICKVPNCNKLAHNGQEGFCQKHYDQLIKLKKKYKKEIIVTD